MRKPSLFDIFCGKVDEFHIPFYRGIVIVDLNPVRGNVCHVTLFKVNCALGIFDKRGHIGGSKKFPVPNAEYKRA